MYLHCEPATQLTGRSALNAEAALQKPGTKPQTAQRPPITQDGLDGWFANINYKERTSQIILSWIIQLSEPMHSSAD